MHKLTLLVCTLAISSLTTAAFADCKSELKSTEAAIAAATDAQGKSEAKMHVDEARKSQKAGNEDQCMMHLNAAQNVLSQAGTRTTQGRMPSY